MLQPRYLTFPKRNSSRHSGFKILTVGGFILCPELGFAPPHLVLGTQERPTQGTQRSKLSAPVSLNISNYFFQTFGIQKKPKWSWLWHFYFYSYSHSYLERKCKPYGLCSSTFESSSQFWQSSLFNYWNVYILAHKNVLSLTLPTHPWKRCREWNEWNMGSCVFHQAFIIMQLHKFRGFSWLSYLFTVSPWLFAETREEQHGSFRAVDVTNICVQVSLP